MIVLNVMALLLGVLAVAYMGYALLFPERF